MKVTEKEKARKKVDETEGDKPEVPGDFICIDPTEKPLVFDFLNGAREDIEEELALLHIRLCLHCRKIAATLLKARAYLEPKAEPCFHAETPEVVEVETERVS
jgi:hypothetical protein